MTDKDQPRFRKALTFLWATFPGRDVEPLGLDAYWCALAPQLTIEELEEAVKVMALDDREFPPRPGEFMRVLAGDLEQQARDEFARLMRGDVWTSNGRRSWIRREVFATMSPRAQAAVSIVGEGRLSNVDPESSERDFLLKTWLKAYVGDTDSGAVRQLRSGSSGPAESLASILARTELPSGPRIDTDGR